MLQESRGEIPENLCQPSLTTPKNFLSNRNFNNFDNCLHYPSTIKRIEIFHGVLSACQLNCEVLEFIKIPIFWINTCTSSKHYATFEQLENMSHPLFKGTRLHRVLTRSRKTTYVNSTLPVDSGNSCM